MQNSAIYRRGIVIPLDEDAELSLRQCDVTETTNVLVLRIPYGGAFERLWEIGLFREINSRCSSMLGDFEEDMVEAESVPGMVAAIEFVAQTQSQLTPALGMFLADARRVLAEAVAMSRPVLFVL